MPTSVANQCALASGELSALLTCMNGKGAKGTVYSITASNIGSDFAKSKACCGNSSCVHSTNSCHYGCPASLSGSWKGEKGLSHGFDIDIKGTSTEAKCQLADIAKSCGAGSIWGPSDMCSGKVRYQSGHGDHYHISTKSCNH